MAKVYSNYGLLKGRIGNARFYVVNGQNIVTSIPRKIKNPKTLPQMKQRIKMVNILGMYQNMKEFTRNNFEGLQGNRNFCCLFRSHNLMQPPVWLPRQSYAHRCVLAPYVVSFGKLPPIEYQWQEGMLVSNLKIGTPLEGYLSGDTIKVILMMQQRHNDIQQLDDPVVITTTLNVKSATVELNDSNMLINHNGLLAVKPPAASNSVLAAAICHIRGEGMNLLASTQHLALSATDIYDHFISPEAMTQALQSYRT